MIDCTVICGSTDEELKGLLDGPDGDDIAMHLTACEPCDCLVRAFIDRIMPQPVASAPPVVVAAQSASGLENFLRRHFYC